MKVKFLSRKDIFCDKRFESIEDLCLIDFKDETFQFRMYDLIVFNDSNTYKILKTRFNIFERDEIIYSGFYIRLQNFVDYCCRP